MERKKTITRLGLVILIVAISTIIFLLVHNGGDSNTSISATVKNVVDVPNEYENGYYAITLQDAAGMEYLIDATGYINTPSKPSDFGEKCVAVPKVSIGDEIEFRLPEVEHPERYKNHDVIFMSCFDDSQSGYFLTVN